MKDDLKSGPACQQCGKPLFGRTDKRFCNDGCRNTFNRGKAATSKAKDHENLPEIFKIIKQNYNILKTYDLEKLKDNQHLIVPRTELQHKGLNFKFFTSTYTNEFKERWKFCFDLGWN